MTKKQENRKKIALLRTDYYAQKNRTSQKDLEFEDAVKEVEKKYGL